MIFFTLTQIKSIIAISRYIKANSLEMCDERWAERPNDACFDYRLPNDELIITSRENRNLFDMGLQTQYSILIVKRGLMTLSTCQRRKGMETVFVDDEIEFIESK